MELKDFVENTLTSILDGIIAAQSKSASKRAAINPSGLKYNLENIKEQGYTQDGKITVNVDFDLAVTVTESTTTKGKIGIISGIFNIGTQGQTNNQNNTISRIRFSIPVLFPSQTYDTEA